MKQELLVLEADKIAVRKRIAELDDEIMALGPEFYEAFNQTSETWHDNAPFEVVRDHQTLLAAERYRLKQVLNNCLPSIPPQKKGIIGIGTKVKVRNLKTNKLTIYFIAGDWTLNAGQKVDDMLVVSRKSPIALTLVGKKSGEEIFFNGPLIIENLE